jgi:hypothetical protein
MYNYTNCTLTYFFSSDFIPQSLESDQDFDKVLPLHR